MLILYILAGMLLLCLCICLYCFYTGFYASRKKPADPNEIQTPVGKIYDPYRASMENWIREVRAMPHEEFFIKSFDGLTLHGNFYEYAPGAPIELMFHGYRGTAERDLSGGVQRCFRVGRSALVVDQRCSGKSGGRVITFGIKEHRDCLSWVDFMVRRFGPNVKIILTGISMGATTVLLAAGESLPACVRGVVADCGFTRPHDIWRHVAEQNLHLRYGLHRHFVHRLCRKRLQDDLESLSTVEAMKRCAVPVLFIHGTADSFVPVEMTYENYEACAAPKQLLIVPGAGHGLSYCHDPIRYRQSLLQFWQMFG